MAVWQSANLPLDHSTLLQTLESIQSIRVCVATPWCKNQASTSQFQPFVVHPPHKYIYIYDMYIYIYDIWEYYSTAIEKWWKLGIHHDRWKFPEMVVPPVLIQFIFMDFPWFSSINWPAFGDPPWLWKPKTMGPGDLFQLSRCVPSTGSTSGLGKLEFPVGKFGTFYSISTTFVLYEMGGWWGNNVLVLCMLMKWFF